MNPAIFKAYDIRGVYPEDLSEEDVFKISRAFFSFVVQKLGNSIVPKIVLSRDGRLSSPSLFEQAKKALIKSGAEVIDIGLAGTPTFYFAVYYYGYDAGIQISASHNPAQYNGLKFVLNGSDGLTKIGKSTGMDRVKKIVLSGKFSNLAKEGSLVVKNEILTDQVREAIKLLKKPKINGFKIVADAGNAVGGLYIEEIFNVVSGKLVKMNFEIDGRFPSHQPDPLQFKTLEELQKKVVTEKADLGIALDGDGDRVFFIDEQGKIIPASLITALLAQEILRLYPGEKIGFDSRNTFNVEHAVKKNKGLPLLMPVGHTLITEAIKKEKAFFAGENSGHYFFRSAGYAEDPVKVVLMLLSIMTREKRPISKILQPLMVSFESGEINFETDKAEEIEQTLLAKFKNGKVSLTNGLSVDFPRWRFNIRRSNTEELVRLNLESFDKALLEEKLKELIMIIKGFSGKQV